MKHFTEYLEEAQLFNNINMSDLNKANSKLQALTFGNRFTSIPINKIDNILALFNIVLLDDDGTEWESLLLGNKGKEKIHLGYKLSQSGALYKPFKNAYLNITWEKDSTNKYVVFANIGK